MPWAAEASYEVQNYYLKIARTTNAVLVKFFRRWYSESQCLWKSNTEWKYVMKPKQLRADTTIWRWSQKCHFRLINLALEVFQMENLLVKRLPVFMWEALMISYIRFPKCSCDREGAKREEEGAWWWQRAHCGTMGRSVTALPPNPHSASTAQPGTTCARRRTKFCWSF